MSTLPTPERPAFSLTRTCRCLRTACLGEMHARRLYLHAAMKMEEAALHVIAHAFRFTAAQEKEHADILGGLIRAHGGEAIPPEEDTPLLLPSAPDGILRAIAQAFRRLAENERSHAQRFLQYLEAVENDRLFREDRSTSWVCLPCGQLHNGCEPPESCSGCGRNRGHFIRSSFFPFVVEE